MINLNAFFTGCYGLYAKGLDRFILIDRHDLHTTFQTAEILSSKIPLIVYAVDKDIFENSNCLEFSIFNKTNEKVGYSSALVSGQTPMLRLLDSSNICNTGMPIDYKQNIESLDNLQDYANFVHQYSYAISLIEKIFNDNNSLIKELLPNEWLSDLSMSAETMISTRPIMNKIKHELYMSSTVEEATEKIIDIWKDNSTDRAWMRDRFYKILKIQLPLFDTTDISGLISENLV